MTFEAIIGLEIHVEMKTKSKMFSSAPNTYSQKPNSQVGPFDMAFPGTMPSVNKAAVIHGIRVANALHMQVERTLLFDRKNYFYADLPKGYQITQESHPLGKNGYLTILDKNGNPKQVRIAQVHLEEDTCKQIHKSSYSLLDYNRAGVPLVEIVSYPDIRNGTEAARYVEAIRNIVVYTGASDGKMERGSLRCDVNISLRPVGTDQLGTKVELKNLNSIKNIEQGIDYEIKRQTACLRSCVPIEQETRRYDEDHGTTVSMRVKTDAVDYKFFCDPNLPPVRLSEAFIQNAIETCPELYEQRKARYQRLGLSSTDAAIILSDFDTATYFEEALKSGATPKIIAKFLIGEVRGYLNRYGKEISDLSLLPESLGEIAAFQDQGYSHKQCADVLSYCFTHQVLPQEAKTSLLLQRQISDNDEVSVFVNEVLEANPRSVSDFKAGKDRAKGFLVGQVMKLAGGKVDPKVVAKLVDAELKKR